ncbi:MAG: 4Fe-4S binding protein [Thermoplasmata archaeon]
MPGMISLILRNLFSKPVTRKYPFEKREPFPTARGRVSFTRMNDCVFCGICMRNCPANAIKVDKATRTNTLEPFKCIQCAMCAELCPKKVIDVLPDYIAPNYEKTELKFTQEKKEEMKSKETNE